jgi:hypothetical protein
VAQIVENDRVMPVQRQEGCHCTTYVPRTPSYKHFHKKHCPFSSSLGNLKSITVVYRQTAGRRSQQGLSHLPLTPRSHDENHHVTDERREGLMLPFRLRRVNSPVAFEEHCFHLPSALDANWRSGIVRGINKSRSTVFKRQFVERAAHMRATPAHCNQRELEPGFDSLLLHVRAINTRPGGRVFSKFETESEMERGNSIEIKKQTPARMLRQNGTSDGLPPAQC